MYIVRILRILTIGFLLVEDFPHLDTTPDIHDTSLYENLCDEVKYPVVMDGGWHLYCTGNWHWSLDLTWHVSLTVAVVHPKQNNGMNWMLGKSEAIWIQNYFWILRRNYFGNSWISPYFLSPTRAEEVNTLLASGSLKPCNPSRNYNQRGKISGGDEMMGWVAFLLGIGIRSLTLYLSVHPKVKTIRFGYT